MAKLIYGLKNNKLYHVDEVDNGLKCNCICPNCKENLVAKQGEINEHHFAHENKECDITIAQETALHIMAKEILAEYKIIKLPKFELRSKTGFLTRKEFKEFDERIYKDKIVNHYIDNTSNEYVQSFDNAYLEKQYKEIIPDVFCEYEGNKLFIEIAVTNFINETKYLKIKESKIPTIEINLSSYKDKIETLTKRRLSDILIDDLSLKKWIWNPIYENNINSIIDNNKVYINNQVNFIEECCSLFLPEQYMINSSLYFDTNHVLNFWRKQKISEKMNMPWYVGQHIYGDFIFNIDRRIWQILVINLIYNSKFPATPKSLWNYMNDKNFLKIDKRFIEPQWISDKQKFSGFDVIKMYYDFLFRNKIINENGLFTNK